MKSYLTVEPFQSGKFLFPPRPHLIAKLLYNRELKHNGPVISYTEFSLCLTKPRSKPFYRAQFHENI